MTDKADLHIHTTASGDALNEPEAVFQQAKHLGLKAISFTDHDSVLHHSIGHELSRKYQVEFIPGIEVSSSWKGQVAHVLAYFEGEVSPSLVSFLEKEARAAARKTAVGLIGKMREMGFDVTVEEYDETAGRCTSGDSPLLRLLMRKHYVKGITEHKEKFGIINHEDNKSYSPGVIRVMEEIHRAGGVAVIAHPAGNEQTGIVNLGEPEVKEMVKYGLDGIEVFHELNSTVQRELYLQLAAGHNLLVTGGSDSHGLEGARPLGSHYCPWGPEVIRAWRRRLEPGKKGRNG